MLEAGPEFASPASIAHTELGQVLPAQPTVAGTAEDASVGFPSPFAPQPPTGAGISIGAFRPALTDLGLRDPVTADLPGTDGAQMPDWGHWYRQIDSMDVHGQVLLQGNGGKPLLILDHVGQGRVGLLLSDQIWLWARGHDGGGPQAELLRRLAHWLMKEPALDENRSSPQWMVAPCMSSNGSFCLGSRQSSASRTRTVQRANCRWRPPGRGMRRSASRHQSLASGA